MAFRISKVTDSPKHHFFGFHDLLQTNAKAIWLCRWRLRTFRSHRFRENRKSVLVVSAYYSESSICN